MVRKMVRAALSAVLALACLTACGRSSEYTPLDNEDDTVYTVGILSHEQNGDLEKGLADALSDTFGSEHIVTVSAACTSKDDTASVRGLIEMGAQLIVTCDWRSLRAAYSLSQEQGVEEAFPIVSTGVNDIPASIGIEYADETVRTTGINVTGVTPQPPVSAKLSELIEVAKKPERVGIIYSPENIDAVKENRVLEQYLTEAGIGYREYLLPTTVYKTLIEDPEEEAAIKSSDDQDPTSTLISDEFVKSLHPDYSDAQILRWMKRAKKSIKTANSDEIISTVIRQCDSIFISGGFSEATVQKITKAAKNADLVSFGSDATAGEYSLVTLWADPYDSGYKAGEQAYQILVNGQYPGDIQIASQNSASFHKLYSGAYAEVLGATFPKSFTEYTYFMEHHLPGQDTEKVGSEEDS